MTMATDNSPGKFTMAAFAAAVVLGGGNFLAVRFSNVELEPFWGAGLRFSLAAVAFVAIALALRLPWPRGRQMLLIGVYGLFTFTLSYALMYWALVTVTAGMTAVVLAMVPLITVLLAALQRLEVLRWRAVVGAAVALVGIVVMTIGPDGLIVPLGGLLAILTASLTIGQSVVLGKRVADNHPVIINAVGMSIGAPLLLGISAFAGETWALPRQSATIAAVVYLVLLGSVGLFVLFLLIVRRWTASATSYAFVLFPVVTMLAETWLLDEPISARGVVGALVVMTGVWFGALAPSRAEAKRSEFPGAAPEGVLGRPDQPGDTIAELNRGTATGH